MLMMPKLELWPFDVALISSPPPPLGSIYHVSALALLQTTASEQTQEYTQSQPLGKMRLLIIFADEFHLCVFNVNVVQSGAKQCISALIGKLWYNPYPHSFEKKKKSIAEVDVDNAKVSIARQLWGLNLNPLFLLED